MQTYPLYQIGSKTWIDDFVKRETQSQDTLRRFKNGIELYEAFDKNDQWTTILHIKDKEGLGMKVPEKDEFGLKELVEGLGEDMLVDIIDVYRQKSNWMTIGRFKELYCDGWRKRIFNILSLHIHATRLQSLIDPPSLVSNLSWANTFFPLNENCNDSCDRKHKSKRPHVEKMVLVSMGGSFTNWHIDFGGSSFYFYVHSGKKVFYLVYPSSQNIQLFKRHQLDEVFYGGIFPPGVVQRIELNEGETLIVPGGWLHSVFTPVDSIVFTGNFLCTQRIGYQLDMNEYETRRNLFDYRFVFPSFELLNFYEARRITMTLNERKDRDVPRYLVDGGKEVIKHIKLWITRDRSKGKNITSSYIHGESKSSILRNLTKAVKSFEGQFSSMEDFPLEKKKIISIDSSSDRRITRSQGRRVLGNMVIQYDALEKAEKRRRKRKRKGEE